MSNILREIQSENVFNLNQMLHRRANHRYQIYENGGSLVTILE